MWKLFMRLMEKAGDEGGGGGGAGAGAGAGAGGGKPGDGGGKPPAGGAGILQGGAAGAGAAGDKGGKPGAGDGTGDSGDAWLWAENVPGSGIRPPWLKADKYKSVDAQARAAVELETKLGPAAELIGAPVDKDGKPTAYALPELKDDKGQPSWEWDAEDPQLKAFQAEAAAMGLSQKAFDRIVTTYAKGQMEAAGAAELQLSEALQKLGPNVAERVAAVQQFVTSKVGAEGFAALDGALGTNVEAFKAFEKIVALSANDARLAGAGGKPGLGFTKADIQAEQFKTYDKGPLAGQRVYDHDAEHRKKVDGMWSQLFPGQDEQQVG